MVYVVVRAATVFPVKSCNRVSGLLNSYPDGIVCVYMSVGRPLVERRTTCERAGSVYVRPHIHIRTKFDLGHESYQ